MVEISEGTAKTFRASARFGFSNSCSTLNNDPQLAADAEQYLAELLGPHKALSMAKLNPGGRKGGTGSVVCAWMALRWLQEHR